MRFSRMTFRLIVCLLAFGVAGCMYPPPPPEPAPAPPSGEVYHAVGTEPFWSVTIADGRISFDAPDEPRLTVPAPPPRTTFNGHRYETPRLTVDITHGRCSDGMSDRIYADTVLVIVDGRDLHGCGGAILPPSDLAGTSWAIVAINGEAVSGPRYSLQFTDNRVSGQAGCNRFSGAYRQMDDSFTTGPIISTKMACLGDGAMAHEQAVLRVLGGPVRVSHPDGDTLLLSGNGGTIRLRRSI